MESNDLDKLFQDAFEYAEETPNEGVWLGIEQELAREKKAIPFYLKYRTQLAIAATFLLFFGLELSYYNYQKSSETEKINEIIASMKKTDSESTSKSTKVSMKKETEVRIETQYKSSDEMSIHPKNTTIQNQVMTTAEINTVARLEDISTIEIIERVPLPQTENIVASVEVDLSNTAANYQEVKIYDSIKDDISTSFVFTTPNEETKSSIITKVLNGITKNIISKNIDMDEKREIEFKNDEEGSLTINILNSFAKK